MRTILLTLLVLLLSTPVMALSVYNDKLGTNEPLYIESCLPVNTTCENSTLINQEAVNNSCSVYAYNVTSCNKSLTINTERDTQNIQIEPYRNAARDAESDETSISLARKAYSLHITNQSYQEEINQLITLRNETSKCWPQTECSLSQTTETLLWLSRAGFNRENRVYDDSLNYVEAQQNKFENEDWTIKIDTRSNESCTVTRGDTTIHDGDVANGTDTYTFTYQANEELRVDCERDFIVSVRDDIGTLQDTGIGENDNDFFYYLPGGCWPEDNTEKICNAETTANALTLTGLTPTQFEEGQDWVEAQIQRGIITGERLGSEENIITHSRLYEALENDEIRQWLLFNQNNDGSFADEDTRATLEAVYAINEDSEWIQDAKQWLLRTRPSEGYEDSEKDSLTYSVFRQREQELRVTPPVLSSTGEDIQFTIHGNITEDTQVYLSESIPGTVTRENTEGTITIENIETGYTKGYLEISNKDIQRKIPVVLRKDAEVTLDLDEELYVTEGEGQIRGEATLPEDETCSLTSTRIIQDKNISRSGSTTVPYNISEPGSYTSTVNMTCNTPTGQQSSIEQIDITYYNQPPFTLTASNTEIDGVEYVYIKNNIPENITTINEFETQPTFYSIPTTAQIPPGRTAKIALYQRVDHTENLTEENILTVQSKGYEDSIDLTMIINNEMETVEEDLTIIAQRNWTVLIASTILIVFLGGAGYTYYTYKQNQDSEEIKEEAVDKNEEEKEGTTKETEKVLGEIELGIQQLEGKTDTDNLKEQGYSDTDIKEIEGLLQQLVENEE